MLEFDKKLENLAVDIGPTPFIAPNKGQHSAQTPEPYPVAISRGRGLLIGFEAQFAEARTNPANLGSLHCI